jgi:hypothetical protein
MPVRAFAQPLVARTPMKLSEIIIEGLPSAAALPFLMSRMMVDLAGPTRVTDQHRRFSPPL